MSYKIKIPGIYIITCLSNSKHYIGRSVNCKERLSKHKSLLKERSEFNIVKSHIFKNHGEYLSKEEIYERNSKSHDSMKVKVLGYYLDGIKIGEFNSYYEAGKFTNLDPYKISLCFRGLQKRVKNTYWLAV